jgi:hypothetical protein
MKAMDLSGLVRGLMLALAIALAFGKLSAVKKWAIQELSRSKELSWTELPHKPH